MVTNPFLGPSVASRYARARPNLHGEAIAAFSDAIGHAKLAIDLGCGTGMSTHALVGIAESVVGMDASPDMLAKSRRAPDVSFVLGVAERLPFADRTFDFATVASAIHWFRLAAIEEVRRVLSAGGRLAVYDIRFRAEMIGVDSFGDWIDHRRSAASISASNRTTRRRASGCIVRKSMMSAQPWPFSSR